jgi:hypothetical protein
MTYQPQSVVPMQIRVGILNDFFMGCLDVKGRGPNGETVDVYDAYVDAATEWTTLQLLDKGYNREQIKFLHDHHEEAEDTPIYDDYYRLRAQFVRKVLTAAANSL